MTPSIYIGGTAVLLLSVALYFTGSSLLDTRDKLNTLEHEQEVAEIKRQAKEEKEQAVAEIREYYDNVMAVNEHANEEKVNELTIELMSAREDARGQPIQFGDDLIRNLIFTDCMWALGNHNVQGRNACNWEAANADPSGQNFSYTTITPDHLANWAAACDDYATIGDDVAEEIYTMEDWRSEYDNGSTFFDPMMCEETLIALTPDFSKFLELFVNKGTDYITRLRADALEQRDIVEQLTRRFAPAPETN